MGNSTPNNEEFQAKMKSSVAFLMCVLAGSSVVSGLKCYDYTCPTASTLNAPASSALDCVAASAATCLKSDGTTACTYAETYCAFTAAVTGTTCAFTAAVTGTTCTYTGGAAPAGTDTCFKADGTTACAGFTAGTSTQAECEAIVDVAAADATCLKADGTTACAGFTAGTSTQAECEALVDVAATTCTYTAAVTATTDTCTPCKNTCATGQECFNQEGTSAGNTGGCVVAGGESGAISGGGSQSICTTDLCNDNTGTSPAFRAEFLSALVVAIFASLY